MDPITTVSTAGVAIPAIIIAGTVAVLRFWRRFRRVIGTIFAIFTVFALIGPKWTLVLLAAGVGWILQSGSVGQEWFLVAGGWMLWVCGILLVILPDARSRKLG